MRMLVLTLTIASLLVLPSLTHAQKYKGDKSLILYLPFDEGEGDVAHDVTQNENHGELDAPEWVDGKFGSALEFNGESDVVIIPTSKSEELQMAGLPGTIMCWFNVKGNGNSNFPRLISKESTTGHVGGYTLRFKKFAEIQFQLSVEGGSVSGDKLEAAPDHNKWYHGAGTWKVGDHIVYLNGEIVNRDAADRVPLEDKQNDLRIGGSWAGPRNFQGIIDEVRIWDRVLSQEEIKENMDLDYNDILSVSPHGHLTTTWGKIKKTRLK